MKILHIFIKKIIHLVLISWLLYSTSSVARNRSSHRRCSLRKGVLRNFAKFTGKHLCQSLLFSKVAGLRPATLLKKRLWHRCFPVNFVKFLRTSFLQNTSGWLLLQEGSLNWWSRAETFITPPFCFILLSFYDKYYRSSHPEVFLGEGVLKICSKFTEEHPPRSAISIKSLCNFILKSHVGMDVLL